LQQANVSLNVNEANVSTLRTKNQQQSFRPLIGQ